MLSRSPKLPVKLRAALKVKKSPLNNELTRFEVLLQPRAELAKV